MKKIFTILVAVLLTATVWAQSPEKMSYQAVVRDGDGALVTDTQVGMQISLLQGSANGTVVYSETQTPTTNANGLVSLEIGDSDLASIDWADGVYFIKTETDPTGGTSYSIVGTSQLLSVPYALHAKTVDGIPSGNTTGDMQYWNGSEWTIVEAGTEGDILTFVGNKPTWSGGGDPFGTVENPTTGETWIDRNLGASQVATSSTDADSYGDLYQWGRAADGHQIRTSGTTSTLSSSDTPGHGDFIINGSSPYDWRSPQNNNLWQGVSGTNNPCPSGYRLPTRAEWNAEKATWSSNNSAGAFASVLKLPMAGGRGGYDGSLGGVGSIGDYWSSSISGIFSRLLSISISSADMYIDDRAYGLSVRCIKD